MSPPKNFAAFSSKIRTSWYKIALTNIYMFCKASSPKHKKAVMNSQIARPPNSPLEPPYVLHGIAQAAIEAPAKSAASDRIYQLAALGAGLFLLGTML